MLPTRTDRGNPATLPNRPLAELTEQQRTAVGESLSSRYHSSTPVVHRGLPSTGTTVQGGPRRLHALIIGIDTYKNHPPLLGAVNDADAFEKYLVGELYVPSECIVNLRNSQATRKNIIKEFENITNNPLVSRGDSICIYFSGYAGSAQSPVNRTREMSNLRPLISSDAVTATNAATRPISHGRLEGLIRQIARSKGNNIVLILDSRHSSSGASAGEAHHPGTSGLPQAQLTHISNDNIHTDRPHHVCSNVATEKFSSYVLLAASGKNEPAMEDQVLQRGYFSLALLRVLESSIVGRLSYEKFIRLIGTITTRDGCYQIPVCEGKFVDRGVFHDVVKPDHVLIPITRRLTPRGTQEIVLEAGAAYGVTINNIYNAFATKTAKSSEPSRGTLSISAVRTFEAVLSPHPVNLHLPSPAYARYVRQATDGIILVAITSSLERALDPSSLENLIIFLRSQTYPMKWVTEESAEFLVDVDQEGHTSYRISIGVAGDELAGEEVELWSGRHRPDVAQIVHIIKAAASWSFYLRHTAVNHPLQSQVKVEVFQLHRDAGGELAVPGPNLIQNGTVVITSNEDHYYGMRLHNTSATDLYAYVYTFTASTLAIDSWFVGNDELPPIQPTLQKFTRLTLGWGCSETVPLVFVLDEGHPGDVVIIKAFLSTKHVDLPPFEQSHIFSGKVAEVDVTQIQPLMKQRDSSEWDSVSIKVIQRPIQRASGPYYVSSKFPVMVKSVDRKRQVYDWFCTRPLSAEDRYCNLTLTTVSKDQGSAISSNGNWTWFEVFLKGDDGQKRHNRRGRPLAWTSHYNDRKATDYKEIEGPIFGPNHDLWQQLADGDSICVAVIAQQPGWVNDAKEGTLKLW